MSEAVPTKNRGGRPAGAVPKKVKGGKGRAFSANVTQEIREALEQEAERTGRSMSQVAERWLDEARVGHTTLVGMVGSHQMAAVVEKLAAIAADVERATVPEMRRDALIAAWIDAIPHLLPYRPSQIDFDINAQSMLCHEAAVAAWKAIRTAPADDPVRVEANRQHLGQLVNLEESGHAEEPVLAEALVATRECGETAADEIDAAILAAKRCDELIAARRDRARTARRAALAISKAYVTAPPSASDLEQLP